LSNNLIICSGKSTLIFFVDVFSNSFITNAQESEFTPSGNVYGRVFSDFEVGLAGDDLNSAFEVTQAYFGYKYKLDKNISAYIKLDIGSPEDLSLNSHIKRYAYFKNAGIKYTKEKHNKTYKNCKKYNYI